MELFWKFHQTKVFDEEGNLVDYDKKLRSELVARNVNLVSFVMNKFYKKYTDPTLREELYQEGVLSLFDAVNGFDPTKGYTFSTYATWWVKQACHSCCKAQSSGPKIPSHIQTQYNKTTAQLKANGKKLQDIDANDASDYGITSKMLECVKSVPTTKWVTPLSTKVNADSDHSETLADMISDEKIVEPHILMQYQSMLNAAKKAFEKLSNREKLILLLRFNVIQNPAELNTK